MHGPPGGSAVSLPRCSREQRPGLGERRPRSRLTDRRSRPAGPGEKRRRLARLSHRSLDQGRALPRPLSAEQDPRPPLAARGSSGDHHLPPAARGNTGHCGCPRALRVLPFSQPPPRGGVPPPAARGNTGGVVPPPAARGNTGGAVPPPAARGNTGGASPLPVARGNTGGFVRPRLPLFLSSYTRRIIRR